MSISLNTDIQPGKHRDPFLEVQMQKIAQALNALDDTVHTEAARIVLSNSGITPDDFWILADATAGPIILNLPLSALATHSVGVKKTDGSANTVTVNASGTELIDGAASGVLTTQYAHAIFVSDKQGFWWLF